MAKIAIPIVRVMCEDGSNDYNVGLNPNTNTPEKVQAFTDCFHEGANMVYNLCHRFPVRLTLAMWGAESGWGQNIDQYRNQNWANMIYTSATNPVGNIGKGVKNFAMFEGRNHHAIAVGYFFQNNPRYSALINYLKSTSSPDIQTCITHIAQAGYCEGDPGTYVNFIMACVNTVLNHSGI